MTLLDAYALIAFLIGGPAAAQVRAILREGDAGATTTNLAETLYVCERQYGLPIDDAMEALEPLFGPTFAALPLDVATARRAARIRARHYNRRTCPISLADAVLIASAASVDRIATADPDVLRVTRAEQLATVALLPQG